MEKRNRGGSLHIGFKPSTMLKHLFLILFLVLSTAKGYSQCPIVGYSYIGNFDGHHYYLSNYGTNPSLAYGDAVAAGGYLASINSAAENDWLSNLVPDYITIGLSDLAVEGTFVWHSGEPLTYSDWWPGEPNNSGDEDYTVTNFGDIGKWNDVPDWVTPQFIVEFVDSDADGTMDICDNCPSDPNKTEEGICGCGVSDADSDGDGTVDCNDGCPTDPNKTEEGICGCGVSDADSDGDGTVDCNDGCPTDPNKTEEGICGCGVSDADSDGDGTVDCNDGCPTDPNKTTPGQCGCGNAETDSDCDGIADCNDVCPGGDDAVDSNGDNIPDCSQLLNYNSYSNAWKCGKDKILVCHNGNNPHSICINKNALSAHFNHGDNIGPCTSCGNAIKVQDHYEDVEGDHDHALEDVDFQTMKIVPNPASDDAEIWLEGLNAPGIITLLDLNGKVHWQTKFAAGQNIIKLDDKLVDRVSGTYLIRLVSGNKIITKYIVIIK